MDMRILQLDASKRVSKIHGTVSLLLMTEIRKESPSCQCLFRGMNVANRLTKRSTGLFQEQQPCSRAFCQEREPLAQQRAEQL